jgi:hypothetical protein
MSETLVNEQERVLLSESLRAVNPKADVAKAIAKVVAAIGRHQRRAERLTTDERLESLGQIHTASMRLARSIKHAPPEIGKIFAEAVENTPLQNKARLGDVLLKLWAACMRESQQLKRRIGPGRPKSGGHLRELIFELVRIFETTTTGDAMEVSNQPAYRESQGWVRATKHNAGRRFVEVVLFEVLGATLGVSATRTVLLQAKKKVGKRTRKRANIASE